MRTIKELIHELNKFPDDSKVSTDCMGMGLIIEKDNYCGLIYCNAYGMHYKPVTELFDEMGPDDEIRT